MLRVGVVDSSTAWKAVSCGRVAAAGSDLRGEGIMTQRRIELSEQMWGCGRALNSILCIRQQLKIALQQLQRRDPGID